MGIMDTLPSGSGNSWKYPNIGDTVSGKFVAHRIATSESGEQVPVLTLEQSDGESVDVWVSKSAMGSAIKTAVADAGAKDLAIGGTLTIKHHECAPAKPGKSPAKLFKAKYVAPSTTVSVDDF